jgi:hypothetical protein
MGRTETVTFKCDRCDFEDSMEAALSDDSAPLGWTNIEDMSRTVKGKGKETGTDAGVRVIDHSEETWCPVCSDQFQKWYDTKAEAVELHS